MAADVEGTGSCSFAAYLCAYVENVFKNINCTHYVNSNKNYYIIFHRLLNRKNRFENERQLKRFESAGRTTDHDIRTLLGNEKQRLIDPKTIAKEHAGFPFE